MPHKYPNRNQLKHTKKPYRVRNWREYEASLRKRGDLTLWFSEEAIRAWHAPIGTKPGGQRRYSDLAIETALTVRSVYGLALRQTEGFLQSVAQHEILDHSTLSRRSSRLKIDHRCTGTIHGPVHVLVDSTGLKVHRGSSCPADSRNRRTWRKLHLVVDATTAEIRASELTTHRTHDSSPVSDLLAPIDRGLASVAADGAYDMASVYDAISQHASHAPTPTRILIPPRRNAKVSHSSLAATDQRDQNIRCIGRVGRRRWQKDSGYTRRSLVETAMSRFKMIIGCRLRSRSMRTQVTDTRIACSILNTMTTLGMPDGYCAT